MLSSFPGRLKARQLCAIPAAVIALTLLYLFVSTDDLYTRSVVRVEVPTDVTHVVSPGAGRTHQAVTTQVLIQEHETWKNPSSAEEEKESPSKIWKYEAEKADAAAKASLAAEQARSKETSTVYLDDEEIDEEEYEDEDEETSDSESTPEEADLELNPVTLDETDDTIDTSDLPINRTTEYLALCVAVKNQHADLIEFLIHHYQHMGVSRFYIMDDGSSPPLSDIEFPWTIPRTALTFRYYTPLERTQWMQLHVYDECIAQHGHKHTWMGFIDADEFLQVKGGDTLKNMLHALDANRTIGALAINWEIHNSNGLLTRPYSARKSFTTCVQDPDPHHDISTGTHSEHVKSIVKTEFYDHAANPHKMALKNGTITVGELGDRVDGKAWRVPVTRERISLHHYSVKSRAEFEEKMVRSNGMNDPKKWDQWEKIHSMKTRACNDMVVYDP